MMRKTVRVLIFALLVMILLVSVSCTKAASPSLPAVTPVPAPAPAPSISPGKGGVSQGDRAEILPTASQERMIVRTGEMSVVVEDVVKARDEIAQLAVRYEGYVVSSQISGEEQERRGWISLRVPDGKFEQALAEIRKLAVRVKSESTSSRDVTEEYVDLTSRLKNAEATESQYLALLQKATNVEDILRIYDSLSRVRNEIEQIKGRMQYLERTSSMSLINVRLEPRASAKPLAGADWNALEVLKSAIRGIITFGQWLGTIILWAIVFIPVWGTVLGIILWRRRKKRA